MEDKKRQMTNQLRHARQERIRMATENATLADALRDYRARSATAVTPSSSSSSNTHGQRMRELRKSVKHLTWQPSLDPHAERISTFLDAYELVLTTEGATHDELLQLIGPRFKGFAFDWYLLLMRNPDAPTTWVEFKQLATNEYQPQLSFGAADQQLRSCTKMFHETYNQHLVRFNRCLQDVPFGSVSPQTTLAIYLGCLDPAIAYELELKLARESFDPVLHRSSPTPSLAQVSSWAETLERARKEFTRRSPGSATQPPKQPPTAVTAAPLVAAPVFPAPATQPAAMPSSFAGVSPNYRGKKPIPGFQYQKGGSTRSGAPPAQDRTDFPGRNATAAGGGVAGQPSPPAGPSSQQGKKFNGVCYGCGQAGHIRRHCPSSPPKLKTESSGASHLPGQ